MKIQPKNNYIFIYYKMLTQTTYPDCRILYKTEHNYITIDMHMAVLSKSAYFDALFRWKESTPIKVNMMYLNQYTVEIPFDYSLMDFCIKMMYNPLIINDFKQIDIELYSDLLDIVDFLQLDNTFYANIIEMFLEIIDEDEKIVFKIVQSVCNSNIDVNKKKIFVARTFYLLTDEEKSSIDKEYIHEHIYSGKSYIDEKGNIVVVKYNGFTMDEGKITTTTIYSSEDNVYTFFINGPNIDKFNITFKIFDGVNIYIKFGKRLIKQLPYNCTKYAVIEFNELNCFYRYEFILEPKTE